MGAAVVRGAKVVDMRIIVIATSVLIASSALAQGQMNIGSGSALRGTGTANGDVIVGVGGALTPGTVDTGLGCLSVNGNLTISGTLDATLSGTTQCTGFPATAVVGTVTLSGSPSVLIAVGHSPAALDTYVLIDNDATDAVSGTFSGLAEGATFASAGTTFAVTYVGGDGNDVAIKVAGDECTLNVDNCDANASCSDTNLSFTCSCNTGYSGDGVTCANIDECTAGTDDCHADATCADTVGSWTCSCHTGYSGDGVTCANIDECTAGTDDCHADATCADTVG
ncbi:MAG: hypothetical protein ACI9WU_000498, partial [Myxococcota bacterium]